ncbi:MAG: hypothetical protein NT007_00115, partial [Candidatus Kapabacteria bacterium]|nr:hypothetical protein [Candidatus Kapabacteria bacterium]
MYNRYPYHTAIAIIAMIFILINSNLFAYDDWELVKGPFCGHFTCFGEDLNKKLFAGSWGDGLYQLSSDGSTWTKVSTNLADPYITCMFIDSTNKIYVGTYGNGVNVSSNSGVNWTQLSSGISNLKIKAIIKNVNNQLLAATNGSGVFRSTNNGTSWIESNSGLWFRDVNALLLCRNGIIIAATNGGGFYNSTDGGISWRKANTKTTITNSNLDYAYKMILQTDGSVYASSPNRGVIYSIDNGLSWDEQDTTGMPTFNTYALAFDHERYVIAGTRFNGIYFHNDLVYSTWTQSDMKSYGPEAIIRASNGKHYAAIPMKGIYRSIDDGIHWTKHSFGMKNYGLMGLTAYKNGIIYAGRETGGAFLSTDYGKNWAAAGLDTFMIRTFAFDSSGNVLAGTIHGIYKSTNNGLNWSLFGLKDSLINHISIASNGVIFANAPDLYKSTNGGTSWSVIVIVTGPKGDPIPATVAAINRNNDAYASVSGFGIYKAPNLGAWTISNNNLYAQTENLNIYFNYSGHIYTASSWGGMYISTNNGTSWNRDTLGLLSHRVSEIALNSIDIPYVALTDGSGIYSKISTNKWRSANSNIMYADYLTIASSGNGNIYVCTDAVYMTRDSNKLSIPTLLSPASGTTEIDVLPQLTWTAVQDVEAYEFQISDAEDFSAIVEYRTQLQNSVNIERDLYFSTQYFWRVRSKYNNHVSEWSNVSSFVTIFPPPVLIYPANNARGIRKNHNLLWHSIDSTARYEYQVSIDSTFSSIASTQANLTDTSAPVSLKDYTHYYWRARHANKYGVKSPWSNYNAYLTAVAPPVLKSPPDQSANLDTVVVMTWDTSVASTKYIILISKSPDFSPDSIIYEGTTDENNRHRMPLLQFNKTYWWKIKAGNDDGYGEFCDPWSYTTGIKVPLLASPADSV